MSVSREAAEGRMKEWRGHDERDEEKVKEGARQLYSALTGADDKDLDLAAMMTQDAFWIADRAEEAMEDDETEREEKLYNRSARLLKEAYDQVGLDWKPLEYRGNGWWKEFRRANDEGVKYNLIKENAAWLGFDPEDPISFQNIQNLRPGKIYALAKSVYQHKEAADAHDKDNWGRVVDELEPSYRAMQPHLA